MSLAGAEANPMRRRAEAGAVTGAPNVLLRLEALAVGVAALAAYARLGASWWLFAILFLAPDLSMLGYLTGRKAGAAIYDAAHWYVLPLACMAGGAIGPMPTLTGVGLIWAAHIGLDRTLGYGLKYGAGFGVTHLGLIGKAR